MHLAQTTFLNSPCWRHSHFPCLSLLKKETLFLSNGIQQFKRKEKSIELCNFLWSPGKTDLGFDSFKMRNLPCSVRSEIGGVFLFSRSSFFFLCEAPGAPTVEGVASAQNSPVWHLLSQEHDSPTSMSSPLLGSSPVSSGNLRGYHSRPHP